MVWFGVVVTVPQTRLERMHMTLLLGACALHASPTVSTP